MGVCDRVHADVKQGTAHQRILDESAPCGCLASQLAVGPKWPPSTRSRKTLPDLLALHVHRYRPRAAGLQTRISKREERMHSEVATLLGVGLIRDIDAHRRLAIS